MMNLIAAAVMVVAFAMDGTRHLALAQAPQQAARPDPQAASPMPPDEQLKRPAPKTKLPEPQGKSKETQAPAKPTAEHSGPASPATEAEFKHLVVMIDARLEGSPVIGAGVIVAQRNDRLYIVTANHVVRASSLTGEEVRAEDIQVRFSWLPGESSAATLLRTFDATLDLAVLAVPEASRLAVPPLAWAALVRPETLAPGDKVIPVGNPLGEAWFISRQPSPVSSVTSQVINMEGALQRGHSGGALATEDWGIAGILRRESLLLGEATRIDLVVDQLKRWNYPVDATFKERAAASGPASATPALERQRQAAEKFAGDWVRAMIALDVSALLDTIDLPFYFDQEILAARQDVERRFARLFAEPRRPGELDVSILRIKAKTVAEAKAEGQDLSRDRVVSSLNIADADWIVTVVVGPLGGREMEPMAFFIRNVDGTLKFVGFWG